jgi:hypothetical protein
VRNPFHPRRPHLVRDELLRQLRRLRVSPEQGATYQVTSAAQDEILNSVFDDLVAIRRRVCHRSLRPGTWMVAHVAFCASQDADGDGICDALDNCPAAANPGTGRLRGDGVGDAAIVPTDPCAPDTTPPVLTVRKASSRMRRSRPARTSPTTRRRQTSAAPRSSSARRHPAASSHRHDTGGLQRYGWSGNTRQTTFPVRVREGTVDTADVTLRVITNTSRRTKRHRRSARTLSPRSWSIHGAP